MASPDSVVSAKRPKAKPVPSWLVTKDWGLDEPRVSDKFVTKGLPQAEKGRGSVPAGSFGEQSSTSHTAPISSSSKLRANEIIADGVARGRRSSHGNTDESSDPSMPHPFPGGVPRGSPNASFRAPPEYNSSVPASKPPPPPSAFPPLSPASTFDTDSSRVAAERKRSRLYSEVSVPCLELAMPVPHVYTLPYTQHSPLYEHRNRYILAEFECTFREKSQASLLWSDG